MKKYKTEMVLMIILIISGTAFVVNVIKQAKTSTEDSNHLKNSDSYSDNLVESYTRYPIIDDEEDMDDLYLPNKVISADIFKKYFMTTVGKEVACMESLHFENVSIFETGSEYVKNYICVNSVNVETEYDNQEADEGYVYLIVNVSYRNVYDYDRLITFYADVYEWTDYENFSDMGYQFYPCKKLKFAPNHEWYKLEVISSEYAYWTRADDEDDDIMSNIILLKANETQTFDAIYIVKKESINANCVLFDRGNRTLRHNSDYMIKLFSE